MIVGKLKLCPSWPVSLSPQPSTCNDLVRNKECLLPQEMSTIVSKLCINLGSKMSEVPFPWPKAPNYYYPQLKTLPSKSSAKEWLPPQATF